MDHVLLRAGEISKRPVVSVGGEDIAQVKDVVYDTASGSIIGFTLAKRGLLSGPMKRVLAFEHVEGFGPDAVVVVDDSAFTEGGLSEDVDDRELVGARVITDDGREVGTVTDLIVEVRQQQADVVGYELEPSSSFEGSSKHILLPLPDALSATGDNLVVPAAATEYIRNDLAGFGAAVDDFRSSLSDDSTSGPSSGADRVGDPGANEDTNGAGSPAHDDRERRS